MCGGCTAPAPALALNWEGREGRVERCSIPGVGEAGDGRFNGVGGRKQSGEKELSDGNAAGGRACLVVVVVTAAAAAAAAAAAVMAGAVREQRTEEKFDSRNYCNI
ncbi:hypothetical protein E2C01_079586 [Portunus trituberculatus]|uniref:Uncharacterized protein n=1 Tax=Portunus trituberculatus TaxID=210409 RepID=A0A5B7IT58_PORTR|nr:hypothetical protein [Portunus trituberculatus]